jgi:hypothetical protein
MVANKKSMERASSRSLTASTKVGYLNATITFKNSVGTCCHTLFKILPFFHNMIQTVNRLVVLFERFGSAVLALCHNLGQLLSEGLVLSEFVQDWFMKKILNILVIIECRRGGGSLVSLLLVSRLARINSLQDTKTSVLNRKK